MTKQKRFLVDTETTGTNPKLNGIIQLSCMAQIDGVLQTKFLDMKIQPFPNDVIEDTALEVNGITREELFSEDRLKPKVAFLRLLEFLATYVDRYDKTDKLHFVAFRAGFDSDFIREWFAKNGDTYYGAWFWTPPLCVMTMAGYFLQRHRHKLENFKLRTVFSFLFPDAAAVYSEEQWHDSLFDIARTLDVEQGIKMMLTGKKKLAE